MIATATRSRSLTAARSTHAQTFLKNVIDQHFDGSLGQASKGIGITYAALRDAVRGKRGIGMRTLNALCAFTGASISEIIGDLPRGVSPSRTAQVQEHPEWAKAEAQAHRFDPTIPRWAWATARQTALPGIDGSRISPQFALELALLIAHHGTPPPRPSDVSSHKRTAPASRARK